MFLQAAALGKQLYDITDSELALGLLGLVEFLPALVLLPLTGSAADRFDRRRVAAIALGVEVLTSVAVLRLRGDRSRRRPCPLFAIAAVFGTARAFAAPSFRSLPPLLAPDGGLPRLIALYSGDLAVRPDRRAGRAAGSSTTSTRRCPYAVAAVCFGVAAVDRARRCVCAGRRHRTPADERPSLHHALEGLRFIRRRPVLLGAIALDLFAVLFGGAVALLPAIAEDRLGVGNVGYGWLRAAPGIGAVRRHGAAGGPPGRRRVGRTLLVAVAVFGVATIVLGVTTSYVVAFVALLVLSGADAVSVFIRATIVPLATPDRDARPGDGGRERVHRRLQRARRVRVRRRRRPARRRPGRVARRRADARRRRRVVVRCSRRCATSTASRTSPRIPTAADVR